MANPYTRDTVPFWRLVQQTEGCWYWRGMTGANGYGQSSTQRPDGSWKRTTAHRVAYEKCIGPIPEGHQIDHLCRNRSCVNPAHLEAVTPAENVRRAPEQVAAMNARKTHCAHGHEYTDENTYLHTSGSGQVRRHCRTCRRDAEKRKAA